MLVPLQALGEGSDDLHIIGTMPTGTSIDNSDSGPAPKMLVDPELSLGVALAESRLFIYDLQTMRIDASYEEPEMGFFFGLTSTKATIDPTRHRVFFSPETGADLSGSPCPTGPSPAYAIKVFSLIDRTWSTMAVPCVDSEGSKGKGSGPSQFKIETLSFDPPSGKLYAVGTSQLEFASRPPVLQHGYGQIILIRQMSPDTQELDWEMDLRPAGCDRVWSEHGAYVGRFESSVVSYCYGPRDSIAGSRGLAVRIPLDAQGMPAKDQGGKEIVRATPTLPNDLAPLLDPGSGRLLLLTAGAVGGAANGNAVWVYDVFNERFFGVIATGVPGGDNDLSTTYVGLNPVTGRAYLLNSGGILVADARHSPLPAGVNYPVLQNINGQGQGNYIAVAPKLKRIFVPIRNRGFVVLQDDVPEPPPPPVEDIDRGTADVPEVAGKTGSVYSGAGAAFGAHILNTGGITRGIDNTDPVCILDAPNAVDEARRGAFGNDRCLSEQVLTSGNRELFLAATQIEFGSETGVAAEAAGAAFPPADTATDADYKRLAAAGTPAEPVFKACDKQVRALSEGRDVTQTVSEFCQASPLSPFQYGTRGEDGRGYPVPGANCEVFGEEHRSDMRRPSGLAIPGTTALGSSRTDCDGGAKKGTATAATSPLSFPDPLDPLFSIGRTSSSTSTRLDPVEGVVTTIEARATGIQIGPISIAEIVTSVTTKAKGRTGSTSTLFHRSINGVYGPGISCRVECDASAVARAITNTFGQRVRASVPEYLEVKSPKGYQSYVIKDPALRDSERAANDDDTYTVNGLTVVFLNDGLKGRNRLVLQLAGVQAESRYGVFVLPEEVAGGSDGDLFEDFGDSLEALSDFDGIEEPTTIEKIVKVVKRIVTAPAVLVRDALQLVVNNPREFGTLFVMWSLLASPAFLAIRRAASLRIFTK